jgi:hypothetical protein
MSKSLLFLSAIAVLTTATVVWASDSDELRVKAEAMHREAVELAEKGHEKEAANLKRKAMAMLEEAERLERDLPNRPHPEIVLLKRRLETLRQEEQKLEEAAGEGDRLAHVRSAAKRTEAEIRHLSHGSHDEDDAPRNEVAHRLEHMRIAVDHLKMAGLHDIAEHVVQRAEATERELHEKHQHHEGDAMHEIMKQLDELRHEVGRLHDEVSELRKER